MPSRRRLLSAVGLSLLGAGCSGGSTDDGTPTQTPTESPTGTPSETPTRTPTRTPVEPGSASDQPNPNHEINVENDHDTAHTVAVTVVRDATGETVYDGSTDLPAGTLETVYNTEEANPEGIETFTVTGTMDGEVTRESQVETNACFGSLHFVVRESGDFDVYYSIC